MRKLPNSYLDQDGKPRVTWPGTRLSTTSGRNVLHNHDQGSGRVVYAGFCPTAPTHHLFKCAGVAPTHGSTARDSLLPFNRRAFRSDSKAGQGGCSTALCPGEAVLMTETRAYCDLHAAQEAHDAIPCQWTSIYPCREGMGLNKDALPYMHQHCPICRAEHNFDCEGCDDE